MSSQVLTVDADTRIMDHKNRETFAELREAVTFYALNGNKFAVENIVREMASRKGMPAAEMAAAIRRGEY